MRWQTHGDPEKTLRRYAVYRLPAHDGYMRVWEPDHPLAHADGYVLEHRKVAWDEGILTDPSMQVHHINHIRDDNRPENLEAKTLSEHAKDHIVERGYIVNQFGRFPLKRLR